MRIQWRRVVEDDLFVLCKRAVEVDGMGRGIEIHPALVIVGVLAGGELARVTGRSLSVPVIAAPGSSSGVCRSPRTAAARRRAPTTSVDVPGDAHWA